MRLALNHNVANELHLDEFQPDATEPDSFLIIFGKIEPAYVSKPMVIFQMELVMNIQPATGIDYVSTEWPFRKPERNETDEQRSAVFETAIECVTG